MAQSSRTTGLIMRRSWSSGVCWIELYGELDIGSAPELQRELRSAEACRPVDIVLDLSSLQFIDSAGLHILLLAQQRADRSAHRLKLTRGPRQVDRLFKLAGCEAYFTFVN